MCSLCLFPAVVGTTDTEINPSAQTPELTKVPSFKPEAGLNIALYASSSDRSPAFLILPLWFIQLHIFPVLFKHKMTCHEYLIRHLLVIFMNFVSPGYNLHEKLGINHRITNFLSSNPPFFS